MSDDCRFGVANKCLIHGALRAVLCDDAAAALQGRVRELEDQVKHITKNFTDANQLLMEREKELSKYHGQINDLLEGGHKLCRKQIDRLQGEKARAEQGVGRLATWLLQTELYRTDFDVRREVDAALAEAKEEGRE